MLSFLCFTVTSPEYKKHSIFSCFNRSFTIFRNLPNHQSYNHMRVLMHLTKDEKTRHLSDCGVCLRSATSASSFADPKPLASSLSSGKSASSSPPVYNLVFNFAPCNMYKGLKEMKKSARTQGQILRGLVLSEGQAADRLETPHLPSGAEKVCAIGVDVAVFFANPLEACNASGQPCKS